MAAIVDKANEEGNIGKSK